MLAIEDGPFSKTDKHCLLVGVITADNSIEELLLDQIDVDGTNSTDKIVSLAKRSKPPSIVMLPSVSLGGFNVVDPYRLNRGVKLPVIVANPERPSLQAVRRALRRHFPDWRRRVRVFDQMGSPTMLRLGHRQRLYFYSIGLSVVKARPVVRGLVHHGKRPEPLRIARILARALGSTPPLKRARGVRQQAGHQGLLSEYV